MYPLTVYTVLIYMLVPLKFSTSLMLVSQRAWSIQHIAAFAHILTNDSSLHNQNLVNLLLYIVIYRNCLRRLTALLVASVWRSLRCALGRHLFLDLERLHQASASPPECWETEIPPDEGKSGTELRHCSNFRTTEWKLCREELRLA